MSTTVADGPAANPGGPGGDRVDTTLPPARRFRLRYAVVGALLLGVLGTLVAEGLGNALDYYIPVDQAVHQRASLGSRQFRLEGVVAPGSVHDTPAGVDFTVTGTGGMAVPVVASTTPPQLFQPDIPVVLDGHFAGTGFAADQIIVKHSSQYIAAHPGRVRAPDGSVR